MSNFLYRVGRVCTRRRWRVLAAWIALVVSLLAVGKLAGGQFVDRLSIPGVEAQKAADLLTTAFPSQAGGSMQVVFHTQDGTLSAEPAASAIAASRSALMPIDKVSSPG